MGDGGWEQSRPGGFSVQRRSHRDIPARGMLRAGTSPGPCGHAPGGTREHHGHCWGRAQPRPPLRNPSRWGNGPGSSASPAQPVQGSPATAEWQSPRVLPDTGTALTPSRAVLTPQRSQILLQQQPKGSFLSPELLAAVLIILMEHLF